MSCGGGHLGFPISIKNIKFVEDLPMTIHVQFGFNNICSFWEEGIWTFSYSIDANPFFISFCYSSILHLVVTNKGNHLLITLCLVCSTIMVKFYEKLWLLKKITNYWHLMNIHVQFGFNNICNFWEEDIWTFSHNM
jgi:hypothetical protein